MLEYHLSMKNGILEVSKDFLSTISDFVIEAEEWANEKNSLNELEIFADMDYDEIMTYRIQNAVNPLCVDVLDKYLMR